MNPDSHMAPDNYQQAWQAHASQTRVTVDADVLLKVVQRDQQTFRSVIRMSDYIGVGIALLLLAAWIYLGNAIPTPWTWYMAVPVFVWWIAFPPVYRIRHKQEPINSDEPLLHCVERSLSEVDDQVWLQRNSFWWNSSPIFVVLLAFALHSAWLRSHDWLDFLGHMDIVVFFLTCFYFVYFLNRKVGCPGYEPRRQELLTLLKSLRDETASDGVPDKAKTPCVSPRVSTTGSLVLMGGGVLLAILIAFVSDPPFQDADPPRPTVGYPKKSPFAAVRWQETQPEVKLGDEWFKLVSLDEIPASQIVAFSQKTFRSKWRKRFEEDLVELLTRMGHPPRDDVTLVVQSLTSSRTWVRKGVAMTEENRRAISAAAQERERARP